MSFNIENYEIIIKVKSGLYIGSADSNVKIGGVDNEFIKNPVTKEPYIPGSSIKGKVRTLLEYSAGILSIRAEKALKSGKEIDGSPLSISDMKTNDSKDILTILKLFGAAGNEDTSSIGITRLSFGDFVLTEDFKTKNVFEIKAETAIDRAKGSAKDGSLRYTERVGAGTEFIGNITMKVFDGDSKEEFENMLFNGLKLLELDTLGGAGSRGYGRIEISFTNKDHQTDYDKVKKS